MSRTTARRRAVIAYLVGLVGTAAGIGIGAGHLAKGAGGVVTVPSAWQRRVLSFLDRDLVGTP